MANKKFTPEVLEAIPKWLASGATSEDIAAVLETTLSSLQVVCSRAGVSLRTQSINPSPDIHAYLRKTLSKEAWTSLCAEAARRGMPVMRLAFTMLEYAAVDNVYSALIDVDDQGRCESSVVQRRNVG